MNTPLLGPLPPPDAPIRRRNSGSGCLIASLIGCGSLVVVAVVVIAFFGIQWSRNPKLRNSMQALGDISANMRPDANELVDVRAGLDDYVKDHDGKYPKTLKELVPKYISSEAELYCPDGQNGQAPLVYAPPAPDSPNDTILIRAHVATLQFSLANQTIANSIVLLKSGAIVQLQETRVQLIAPGESEIGR